jgi:hypothetical protein
MNDTHGDPANDIRPLVRELGKPPGEWQRKDLYDYCLRHGVKVVNFRYPALDGKLKELRLPVNDPAYLERILTAGERVDGSSLFPKLFAASRSDLYVIPVYRWAFANPWAPDELDVVCRFADADGNPSADLRAGGTGVLPFHPPRADQIYQSRSTQLPPSRTLFAVARNRRRNHARGERGHRRSQVLPQRSRLHGQDRVG